MQKYTITRKMKYRGDGLVYDRGDVIELTAAEAKRLNERNLLSIYVGDDDEVAPEPKAKKKTTRKKPAAPKALDDGALYTPDPRAR